MARIEALPDGGLRIGALARMSDVAADRDVRDAFPSSPRRCCSRPPANCATWPRSAATSCSARAAPISATRTARRATNAGRAPAARRCTASIAITPSSDGPMPASRPIPPTWRWRWRRWTRRASCAGSRANDAIPFADFHRLPGDTPEQRQCARSGRPDRRDRRAGQPEGRASHYLKVRDRQSYEFALVSAAAAVATDGRRIRSVRLAMGGVAHKPWRLTAAEAALSRVSLDDIDALKSAIATSFTDARPLAHNAFKVELAQRVASARAADRGRTRMNAIGQPISRADGRLKVTGRARYTADIRLDERAARRRSSTARSPMAGRRRSTRQPPRRRRACWRSSPIAICRV